MPARLAGGDAVVVKGRAARYLFEAIRHVHRGERLVPETSQFVMREALEQLDDADRPIVGMLLDGSSAGEVADVLRLSPEDGENAVRRILARLSTHVRV
jgi:DNA-binding NarL/FixJ family response regulator